MKFIMHIMVKMPTYVGILIFMCMINTTSKSYKASQIFVGILTFICMINTTSKSYKASQIFIIYHFILYEQLKHITSGPGS